MSDAEKVKILADTLRAINKMIYANGAPIGSATYFGDYLLVDKGSSYLLGQIPGFGHYFGVWVFADGLLIANDCDSVAVNFHSAPGIAITGQDLIAYDQIVVPNVDLNSFLAEEVPSEEYQPLVDVFDEKHFVTLSIIDCHFAAIIASISIRILSLHQGKLVLEDMNGQIPSVVVNIDVKGQFSALLLQDHNRCFFDYKDWRFIPCNASESVSSDYKRQTGALAGGDTRRCLIRRQQPAVGFGFIGKLRANKPIGKKCKCEQENRYTYPPFFSGISKLIKAEQTESSCQKQEAI